MKTRPEIIWEILWEILNAHMVDIEVRIKLVLKLFSVSKEKFSEEFGNEILRELRCLENSADDFSDDQAVILNCDEPDFMLDLR